MLQLIGDYKTLNEILAQRFEELTLQQPEQLPNYIDTCLSGYLT